MQQVFLEQQKSTKLNEGPAGVNGSIREETGVVRIQARFGAKKKTSPEKALAYAIQKKILI